MLWTTWLAGGLGLSTALLFSLYYFQNRLIYLPTLPEGRQLTCLPSGYGLPFEDVMIATADGVKIHGWLIKQEDSLSAPTLLFFHGNAGNIGHRVPNAALLYRKAKVNVFLVSYRGYGRSEGVPTEAGLVLDAEASLDYLRTRKDIQLNSIFVFGRSLGGAVAIHLAHDNPELVRGLIVENCFTHMEDMMSVVFPVLSPFKFLLCNKWPCRDLLPKVTVPILFLSGAADELVPPHMMHSLWKLAHRSSLVEFFSIRNGTHNESWHIGGDEYYQRIHSFVDTVLRK
eukprot:TRINITY_DN13618_c0_g1_i1.p1 TRINITY_DN13618_c0_g1~~TRINITY_DN13618_c0_g1_i1.p1  ORF type:complete len:285 (-),score=35.48 TRINITY_DN13618_c0_g1_i1:44-898(-)